MGTTSLAIIDGKSQPQSIVAEQTGSGSLSPHSVPEVGGLPVTSANPLPAIRSGDLPLTSLNAAAAPATGAVLNFASARSNLGMQVSFTGAPTAVLVNLLGSIDGVNFSPLSFFGSGTAGQNASGDIVRSIGVPVMAIAAQLVTLTGGTAPTVTATLLGN
jgi:hypothetical protein